MMQQQHCNCNIVLEYQVHISIPFGTEVHRQKKGQQYAVLDGQGAFGYSPGLPRWLWIVQRVCRIVLFLGVVSGFSENGVQYNTSSIIIIIFAII